jgi:two-component system sensor histidine kinase DesK
VRVVDVPGRLQRLGWVLPWLLFLGFPLADLVSSARPVGAQVLAGTGLVVFTVLYLRIFSAVFSPGCPRDTGREFVALTALGLALPLWLGPSWAGLLIYVSAAAAGTLPDRRAWPVVGAAAVAAAAIVSAHGLLAELFILPLMCLLTAFALRGTRRLIEINAELAEAREERAQRAVVEERLRFARDLHDLLGHSLSLIALKSELAGRLADTDPRRARQEMADVEAVARRALAEVREAVSGYRSVGLTEALAEARPALAAAGITLTVPDVVPVLPVAVDAVLGWVVREATTNVLRHSGARAVTVRAASGDGQVALSVADDGRGGPVAPGDGLSGLTERVRTLGGSLTAGPGDDGGFVLAVTVPVEADSRVGAA